MLLTEVTLNSCRLFISHFIILREKYISNKLEEYKPSRSLRSSGNIQLIKFQVFAKNMIKLQLLHYTDENHRIL